LVRPAVGSAWTFSNINFGNSNSEVWCRKEIWNRMVSGQTRVQRLSTVSYFVVQSLGRPLKSNFSKITRTSVKFGLNRGWAQVQPRFDYPLSKMNRKRSLENPKSVELWKSNLGQPLENLG
jgi:hypothetical protein